MIIPADASLIVSVLQSSSGSASVAILEDGSGQYGRRSRPGRLGSYKVWKPDQLVIDRGDGRSLLHASYRHLCPADKVGDSAGTPPVSAALATFVIPSAMASVSIGCRGRGWGRIPTLVGWPLEWRCDCDCCLLSSRSPGVYQLLSCAASKLRPYARFEAFLGRRWLSHVPFGEGFAELSSTQTAIKHS